MGRHHKDTCFCPGDCWTVWDDEVDVDKETCNLEIITRRVQGRGEIVVTENNGAQRDGSRPCCCVKSSSSGRRGQSIVMALP